MTDPASPSGEALLVVAGLEGWYGESHVLHGIDFDVREGEVVTLLGRNGAGKTSTLLAIMGILSKRKGSVRFRGDETIALQPRQIARLGIALCPEERGIFASLNVRENLLLPPKVSGSRWTITFLRPRWPLSGISRRRPRLITMRRRLLPSLLAASARELLAATRQRMPRIVRWRFIFVVTPDPRAWSRVQLGYHTARPLYRRNHDVQRRSPRAPPVATLANHAAGD